MQASIFFLLLFILEIIVWKLPQVSLLLRLYARDKLSETPLTSNELHQEQT